VQPLKLPFKQGEVRLGRSVQVQEILQILPSEEIIHHSGDKYFWMADKYPAEQISLRSASAQDIVLRLRSGIG
jgi:DEAD/DEAH box helicase domain-containing protein